MGSECVEIEGVGQIVFKKSQRARVIRIAVKPNEPVRVSVPVWVSFARAKSIIKPKIPWIQKHSERLRKLKEGYEASSVDRKEIDSVRAKEKLIGRLQELSVLHGFQYNKVSIRRQKTRWGSCSAKNNISLNMYMVKLPDILIDYIILHELVHTRIKNHSKEFWAELSTYVQEAKVQDKALRKYQLAFMV
ncbi:MAG: M48 family metallopeptidase [Candidatus Ancaeobacter aquaticus]|nr:M48 family metallopeptidase [Candidatus Ancaeobacter aquaticus]